MKVFLAVLFILSACGSIKEYSNKELTLEYELEVPGKSKNQIYSHTSVWLEGPAGFHNTKSSQNSKGEGRLARNAVIDRNISPLNNDFIGFNILFVIKDNHAKVVFSNPRLKSERWLFPMENSKLNMVEEFDGYNKITRQMFDEYSEYIIAAEANKNFERDSVSITGATIE